MKIKPEMFLLDFEKFTAKDWAVWLMLTAAIGAGLMWIALEIGILK